MINTNYIGTIVKILESPIEIFNNSHLSMTEFRVQLPQIQNTAIIKLIFWGTLARDIGNYYRPNDYILIEGYVSLRSKKDNNLTLQNIKTIEIIVLKVYPFLLSYN